LARILGYIASSLDGFIATPDDRLDWLTKYDDVDFGEDAYAKFIASVRTLIMGRTTYDWILANTADWPYGERRTIVVTSRPLTERRVETWTDGIDALVEHARGLTDGDVWMVGGGGLQMAFLERGALDELALTIVPELIGGGAALFPPTGLVASPRLVSAKAYDRGVVHLRYGFG
jgi:dihydrofolate reductase